MSPHRSVLALLLAATSMVASPAHAVIFAGNPQLEFHVSRPAGDIVEAGGHVDKVLVHPCGTSTWTEVTVDADIDLVEGVIVTIPGGDLCHVAVVWGSDVTVAAQSGSNAFVARYADGLTVVALGTTIDPVDLTQLQVVSGTFYGGSPKLSVDVL